MKITSSSDIGLVDGPTPAVLRSSEQINATPTSFSPFGPDWMGSTLQPTVSGAYNGLNGTGTLTFKAEREGTRGVDDLKIKVYDPTQNEIGSFNIKKNDPLDKEYVLDNGLVLTFGQGDLVKKDTFTVDVTAGVPKAYSPIQPLWVGSTALATVDGVYDGADGTGTLTFRVNREGTHGIDDLAVKVYDPTQNEIGSFNIKKNDPLDKEYVLDNGLSFTIGAGFLRKNTTFAVDVFDSLGSVVDASKPLQGNRDLDPNLENGLTVSPGSFELNGVVVAVNAGDSIEDVLARIDALPTGVSASFDAATESVVLTQKTLGSASTIV
ncbi:MAG: hypothetical protein ACR2PS_11505, partial [Pseudomonadales bacterium]